MSKLRLVHRSFVADYCLSADLQSGQPPTAYLINHGFFASRGIMQGMVIVARSLGPLETPPDNSLCLIAHQGEVFLRRVRFGSDKKVWLEDDRECREFKADEVTFSGVALYACSCELNKSLCTPVPLDAETGLAAFRQRTGMLRWRADATGQNVISSELRAWITLLGGDPKAWAGGGWVNFLHPDDRDAYLARWEESLSTGKPYQNHGRMLFAGVWLRIAISGNPIFDSSGQIIAWEGFLHLEAIEKRMSA